MTRLLSAVHPTALRELPQEPHVVLKIKLQIVDVVFELRQTFDAQTEGEAGKSFRIIVDETINGRIDHPRAEQLNPTRLLADVAARTSAEYARRVDFNRRLGERKITRPQARLHFGPQKFAHEIFDRTLEIAERDVSIDGQPLNLVEHESVRRVGIVAAIDLSWHDN